MASQPLAEPNSKILQRVYFKERTVSFFCSSFPLQRTAVGLNIGPAVAPVSASSPPRHVSFGASEVLLFSKPADVAVLCIS